MISLIPWIVAIVIVGIWVGIWVWISAVKKPDKRHYGGYAEERGVNGRRIGMHNRYMPEGSSPETRNLRLVDQILGDQEIAHEKPGRIVHGVDPGDRYYVPPSGRVVVTVGDVTVILRRDAPPLIVEVTGSGCVTPEYEVPQPWDSLIALLAFEIAYNG